MTERSFLSWKIQDAMMRMQSTPDPNKKLLWAKVMNDARRERGDFAGMVGADLNGREATARSEPVEREWPEDRHD